jgi:hypothetical protein
MSSSVKSAKYVVVTQKHELENVYIIHMNLPLPWAGYCCSIFFGGLLCFLQGWLHQAKMKMLSDQSWQWMSDQDPHLQPEIVCLSTLEMIATLPPQT